MVDRSFEKQHLIDELKKILSCDFSLSNVKECKIEDITLRAYFLHTSLDPYLIVIVPYCLEKTIDRQRLLMHLSKYEPKMVLILDEEFRL